jgi:hypothetical protein
MSCAPSRPTEIAGFALNRAVFSIVQLAEARLMRFHFCSEGFMSLLRALAFLGLGLMGCSALGGTGNANAPKENDAQPVDALENPAHPGLEACSAGVTTNTVEDSLEIARDFKESCHELIVCGGLSASLSTTLISVLFNAAVGSDTNAKGFTFDGKGTYSTTQASVGTKMDVQLFLAADTSFGKRGDLITFDLFSIETYFTGAKLTATASVDLAGRATTNLGITFTGKGKGFEILGLGDVSSPFTIDAQKIADALGMIQLRTKIHVDDKQGHATFVYDLDSPPVTIGAISKGEALGMQLKGVTGARADLDQTLTITQWDIRYLDTSASGFLDGTIGFAINGGRLPYTSTFSYPKRKAPDVVLACGAK